MTMRHPSAGIRHRAVIALGSNLGDREATIRQAVRDIAAVDGVQVTAASGLVESHAVKLQGVDEDAPGYLNAVILVITALEPEALLDELNRIENRHGRVREERWGDRTLDLDIVAVDDLRIEGERLTLPHPRAGERAFVLAPWAQLDAEAVIPGRGRVADLLPDVADRVWDYPAEPLMGARR